MKKGAGNHILIGLLIVAVVLLALFFLGDRGFTGFAVFDEAVFGFNGTRENVDYNGSALILRSGQTSGTYTSQIFDANTSMEWNTLFWQGGIPNSTDNSVTNESGWINSTGYTLFEFDSSWSEITLTALYEATDNSQIGLGNATVNSLLGVVTNATADEWNNVLISYDYITPFDASLSFQVRVCSSSDCANESFVTVGDLNNIGLEGRYFQYQADFTSSDSSLSPYLENVVVGSSFGIVSLNISQPTGTKSSQTGISIQFTAVGNNLVCWYNIDNGINTTLPGCGSSSFDVPDDGNYVFNLYANNTLGASDYQSSSFTVDTPAPTTKKPKDDSITGQTTAEVTEIVKLILEDIQSLTMNPGETREITWSVESVLTFPLQACLFESVGEVSSWISHTETLDINAGEEHTFVFDVVVPEGTAAGSYGLGVSLDCPGTDVTELFTVEVVEKKLEFGLISVERTEQNEVEVTYSLEELSGEDQTVEIGLSLLNDIDEKVAEVSTSQALAANAVEEFLAVVPVDETLEGELTLVADLNSEIYSASVQERVVISGTPTAGFAIFGGEGGAGGFIIFLIVVVVLVAIFFIVRYMRKADISLKDFLKFRFRQ